MVAHDREIVAIVEVESLLATPDGAAVFSAGERAFAAARSDPARRLAARLAAKRAAARLLAVGPSEIEVVREGGPPRLELSREATRALRARGAERALVSLTHGRTHAAAVVVLLRGPA